MAGRDTLKRYLNSLSGRTVLGLLGIHLLLIPLLFGGLVYFVKENYKSHFVNQVRSESSLVAKLAVLNSDQKNLQQLADDVLLTGRVAFMHIIDRTGKTIIKSGDFSGETPFKEDFFFGQHDDNLYYISLPLADFKGRIHGALRLAYDETATEEQIQLAYRYGIYLALAYVLMTYALLAFLGPVLLKPLLLLRSASRKIADGHFDETLDAESSISELKSLTEDLNFMRTALVGQARALEHQALHDTLTGLPNRALLQDRVNLSMINARRDRVAFALLLMDLDHFKEVNDTMGHLAGDLVLQQVAQRLKQAVRDSDTVTRLGGDEFALLLYGMNDQNAIRIARQLLDALKAPFLLVNQTVQIGASIGVAMFPEHGLDFQSMLRCADIAMYEAKRTSSGSTVYKLEMDNYSTRQLIMVRELSEAIERGDLVLHYQPKVHVKPGGIYGAEALVRWPHPSRGILPPNEFILIAEKFGLINALTLYVLRKALMQLVTWRRSGLALHMAVNLSARNLQDLDFRGSMELLLREFKEVAPWLELELTESAIMADPVRAMETFSRLILLGVRLSIDDFGTGYSSLAYLKKLPVSEIKIDKSFIKDMTENENDEAIVRATIGLAHDLKLTVVAEGVEELRTLELIAQLGCDLAQGNYISVPLPAEEFEAWVRQREEYVA